MSCIDLSKINWSEYRKVDVKSDNEAWKQVDTYEKIGNEGPLKKIWICKYCKRGHTGNVARIEAHLGGVAGFTIVSCPSAEVPPHVKQSMALAANMKKDKAEENKKRKYESGIGNSYPSAVQSGSSGVNPTGEKGSTSYLGKPSTSSITATGLSSLTTIHGVTTGSGEVYPPTAGMDGSIWPNPQGSMGTVDDTVGQTNTFGLGNPQINAAGDGGNISNAACPEQPSGIVSMAMTNMRSQLPLSELMAGSGAAGSEGADAAFPESSHLLDFNESRNSSDSASQPQIPDNSVAHPEMLSQLQAPGSLENNAYGLVGPQSVVAGGSDQSFQAWLENVLLDSNEQGNSSNSACQPPIPEIAVADTEMLTQAPDSLGNNSYGPTGPRGVEASGLYGNTQPIPGHAIGSGHPHFDPPEVSGRCGRVSAPGVESGGIYLLPRLQRVESSWTGCFGIVYKGLRVLGDELGMLSTREDSVRRQKENMEWIKFSATRGTGEMDEWLKSAEQVRLRSHALFVDAEKPMTKENVKLMEKKIEKQIEEIRELIKRSKSFDVLPQNTIIEFMNCRLESSVKHHLKTTLPMLMR